jgi:hypothetical protein
MSWEEMYRRDYPCKCGKSTYTEVVEMDDWNRRREYRIINCPECAEKERIVEEERKREKAERLSRLKELIEEINAYFEQRYMKDWINYFSSARNKKEVWALATKLGVESYSLTSFYQHNKGVSIENYLEGLVKLHNMQAIMKTLDINDSYLKSKVEEAMELRNSMSVVIGFY